MRIEEIRMVRLLKLNVIQIKITDTKILSAITTFIFSGLLYITQSVNSLYDENGFLIGETLMKNNKPGEVLKQLIEQS